MKNNTAALKKRAAEHGKKSKARICAEKFIGSYFFRYTAIYLILSAIIFTQFLIFRKALVWDPDGIAQHYVGFVYYGVYLRKIIKSLLAGSLVIPQFDLSIGMGNDIFTSLHYYGIGDPLNLVSALVPSKYAAYACLPALLSCGVCLCAACKIQKAKQNRSLRRRNNLCFFRICNVYDPQAPVIYKSPYLFSAYHSRRRNDV